jgi:Domain of unknown function DUF1828.
MNCEELQRAIRDWVGAEIECHSSGANSLSICLPLYRPNGDSIELGIEQISPEKWRISDFCYTRSALYVGGVELGDDARSEEFQRILESFQLREIDNELTLEVGMEGLVESVFDFAHAVQQMLSLQLTLRPQQPTRDFVAIVAKFLAEQRASFEIPAEPIEGMSGRWNFSFKMNAVAEETLVKTVTATSRSSAMTAAERSTFEILDVRKTGHQNSVVVADDIGQREGLWRGEVQRVFEANNIPIIAYESKREALTQLAAKYAKRT